MKKSKTKEPMDLSFALFNIKEKDFQRAKAGYIRRFGQKAWDKDGIDKINADGIMGIFNCPATKGRKWFVEVVAFLVNERYCGGN